MNKILIALLLLYAAANAANPFSNLTEKEIKFHTWVFLVAGSFGWDNYRHQADICHAYHAISNMGVPDDHIIVMMADDIAYNAYNPYPGKIFNNPETPPGSGNYGPDVYEGVPHDYTHDLVTLDLFYKILTGEEMECGSRKSLRSGPEDNVFVFYDDHGDTDSLPFPDGRNLDSAMLMEIINKMVERNMFKNLVIYVEACFSGSLFYKLDLPPNVYVSTAAPVGTFSFSGCSSSITTLCDAFSYSWIHDLETSHPSSYSFQDQFNTILTGLTGYSQGCQYGDENDDIKKSSIDAFFNPSFSAPRDVRSNPLKQSDLIPTIDVELVTAQRRFDKNPSAQNAKLLNKQLAIRKAVDKMGSAIVTAAVPQIGYLATTPCTECSDSCICYYSCINQGSSADKCAFECCNEESCRVDPPARRGEYEQRDSCVLTLSREYSKACQNQHPYMLSTNLLFYRICKQSSANITNAVNEIRAQCSTFDINTI